VKEQRGSISPENPPKRRETREYFDWAAETWWTLYEDPYILGFSLRTRKERTLELFDQPGGKVLDVGCGPGRMIEDFLERGCQFWGTDVSAGMIEEARKHFGDRPDVHLAPGEAERLEYPDDFFDAVLALGVIEYTTEETALREMARVLRPGGTLILSAPSRYSPYWLWRHYVFYPAVNLIRPLYFRIARKPPHPSLTHVQRAYTEKDIARLLDRSGCKVVDVVYFYFQLFPAPLELLLPRVSVWITSRLEGLYRSWLRRLGHGFIIKARKPTGAA